LGDRYRFQVETDPLQALLPVAELRLEGIENNASRDGYTPIKRNCTTQRILRQTLETTPDSTTQWTTFMLART